ncbi:hypothetical protein [Subtercola lobariae]|uniref:Uncharacterized protein n=1 Tax=Subtercola lobariae TaxID=1588641 RepID=A0A917B105_9MICO|nr:hypothetical protein [Subtercola lobariae]GGF12905.1 hypothetical protein GCM10011399_03530 [Subtercola lobariae]
MGTSVAIIDLSAAQPGNIGATVATAIGAADIPDQSTAAVNTALASNPRVPTYLGSPPHSWSDPRGRISLFDQVTGEVVAPAGLIAPYAGSPITNGAPYLGGTFDPVTRR